MQIEILKKSVERFWQTVDFGPSLPDGVQIATCVATGDGADAVLGDGELSIVEKGRAVRMMIEKGQPDGDHALMLVLTLSDGQVVAQDVVVRASDAMMKYGTPEGSAAGHATQGHGVGGGSSKLSATDSKVARLKQLQRAGLKGGMAAKFTSEQRSEVKRLISELKNDWNEVEAEVNREVIAALSEPGYANPENLKYSAQRAFESAHKYRSDPKIASATQSGKLGSIGGYNSTMDTIENVNRSYSDVRREIDRWRAPFGKSTRKASFRAYTGHFAQPTNAAHQDAYAVRAYGSGPDDKRVFRAKTAGLPVASCPECDADAQGERREVAVKELALSRNALSRGKMSRMASALRDGVREGEDFAAIKVAELHDGEGEGPRYAVLPGQGNHRVAHLMLSRKAGTVPVMVVPSKGVASKPASKQLSTSTPSKGAEWTPVDMAGRRARRRERVASKRKARDEKALTC